MKNYNLIKILEKKIKYSQRGLPEDIFLFISRITPLVNVDLFIKDKKKGILLTWRGRGEKYSAGWHFPGGILRFKEKLEDRVIKVAKNELKAKIIFEKKPIEINQIILSQINRNHFVSFLYKCKLISNLKIIQSPSSTKAKIGMYCWFKSCPKNLIKPHYIYKKLFKKNDFDK